MNKRIMRMIVFAATFLFIVPMYRVSAQSSKYYNVTRICGQDRYETSAKIASQFGSGEVKNIILANGQNFPDALAGSVLSKKLNAPIILVNNSDVWDEYGISDYMLKHLSKDSTIYLLGGESSISSSFVNGLKQIGYTNFKRLGGTDRFDTNNSIVDEISPSKGTPVVLVNGLNFPDALSISSVAASKGYPIFMSLSDSIPDSIIQKITSINPSKIYIIGGTGALDSQVEDQLKNAMAYIKSDDLVRISGSNRYETSVKIANYFKLDSQSAILANGENFPDALSGSALASKLNAPIVLTDGTNVNVQKKYIDDSKYTNVYILGGQGSISSNTENSFDGTKLNIGGQFQGGKIIDLKTVDINSDGKLKNIILTCNKDIYIDNITLYVQNVSNGNIIASKVLGDGTGYGEIILADINGDNTPEVISISKLGGSSGMEFCDVETMKENTLTKLDNYNDGEKPSLENGAMSQDNFSFQLNGYDTFNMYSKNFNKSYSVDLTRDQQMQNAKAAGIQVQSWMGHGPVYYLYNIDNSGVYGLNVYEDVSGSCHADVVGGFNAYYKYEHSCYELE